MPAEFATTSVEVADNVAATLATSGKQDLAKAVLDAIAAALAGTIVVEPGPGAEFALADTTFAVDSLPLPTGAASESKLEAVRALLAGTLQAELPPDATFSVDSLPLPDGAATQTTLAAVLAKLIAAPSTEAKQDTANTALAAILAAVDGLEGSTDGLETALSTLNGRDFATQTTLAAILAAVDGLEGFTDGIEGLLGGTLSTKSGLVLGDSGRKTSTSVGTAVALAANTAARAVRVTALLTNTQQINIGGASALAVAGSTAGDPLLPGDSTTFVVTNLNQVFVDVRVSGEGVSYTYWT